jgi:ADP-ribosylglycohydrolase
MGTIDEPINDSKGCGTVMRVAPVGVLGPAREDLDEVFALGCETGAITHGHPSGFLAAGAFAVIVAELLDGRSLPKAVHAARAILTRHEGADEVLEAIENAVELVRDGAPTPEALETLGGAWVAEEAVAIAIAAAWNTESFEDGVSAAVTHGGDSDSTGAMAGNLLGAMLGREAIPERWLEALEMRDVIERVAMDLAACFLECDDPPQDAGDMTERYPGH